MVACRPAGLEVLRPCAAVAACRAALPGILRLAMSGSSGRGGGAQSRMGEGELARVWMCRGHGELDAADGDADQGADLQQLEADAAACGLGELRVGQAAAVQ